MTLYFSITNKTGKDQYTWIPEDYASVIYLTDDLGNRYSLIDFRGITQEPEKTKVPHGGTIWYSLIFPAFREGTKAFSFTEAEYIFRGVEVKRQVYEKIR